MAASLLFVAWMSYQQGPFCGLALAGYYALSARPQDWLDERRAVLTFLAVLLVTMVVYLAGYKLLLLLTGTEAYSLVNPAFSMLTGSSIGTSLSFLRPTNYLGPFEWWNYPVSIDPLSDATFHVLTGASALLCIAAYVWAWAIEAREHARAQVFERYGLALVAALLTFLPLVADGFSLRQHIYIGCVPAIVLVVAHSLSVILASLQPSRISRFLLSAAGIAVLCVVAVGARRGFERALLRPNALSYSFAREQIRRAAGREFVRVVIVAPDPGCPREPCRGMHGYRMFFAGLPGHADSYRKIILDETGRRDIEFKFFRGADAPESDPEGTVRIDFRELQKAESERPLVDTTPSLS
jgi:hypothetical protein